MNANKHAQVEVTVIVAAYNRSNVLRLALKSIQWQTYTDYEVLVIGDACTDDSGDVVAALNDTRFHFHNLPVNIGEQSGPNNEGTRRATGKYIAFLNQDDIWWPDHLESLVNGITESNVDFVFGMLNSVKTGTGRWNVHRTNGSASDLCYTPKIHVPASCWLFRRELIDSVGPWKFYQQTHLWPSHDWLFRAWKKDITMKLIPWMTVAHFPSGKKKDSYINQSVEEHEIFMEKMLSDPGFRTRELTDIALGYRMNWLDFQAPEDLISQAFSNIWQKLSLKVGIHPIALKSTLSLNRKGARLDKLRKRRGLKSLQ